MDTTNHSLTKPRADGVRKLWRYARLYGFSRTLYKAIGRRREGVMARMVSPRAKTPRDIGVIGCGQFAFSTIGFVIASRLGNRFGGCFDTEPAAAQSFAEFYRIAKPAKSAQALIKEPSIKTIYIASNHASHADYAVEALAAGKRVYVEKPIATSMEYLARLLSADDGGRIHAGYNRPFSKAIRILRTWAEAEADAGPLTLSCFVSGHVLDAGHWYRKRGEGTRICGNAGHWLDLMVHLLSWGELPDEWTITLTWSDNDVRDDNLAICLNSARGDLVNIVLSARSEPFEGINETVDLQWGSLIAKIDDFCRMSIWRGSRRRRFRFWPKDVGHERAIMQPFEAPARAWNEVVLSSLICLKIARMVEDGARFSNFRFSEERERLQVLPAPDADQKVLASTEESAP